MLAATDAVSLITAIAALIGSLAALVAAVYGRSNGGKADRAAELAAEVHAAVTTPEGAPPLGELAADVHDTVDAVKEAVNGKR